MVNKVSGGEHAPIKTKTSKKRLLVGISIALIIVIVGILGTLFIVNRGNQKQDTETSTTASASQNPLTTTDVAADAAGGEKGYEIYDEAIKKADSDTVARFYVNKAIFAFNNNDLDIALQAAQEAVAKSNDKLSQAYSVLGMVYESKGEYQKSLESFQKALEIFNADETRTNTSSGKFYEQKIDEIKGKL